MPTPTVITDLDPVAANNFPAGSNAPSVLDDVQRAHAAFIRQNYDSITGANSTITSLGNNTSTVYTTGGTSTAYTITPAPAYTAYAVGMSVMVNFNAASGASPTIAWNGIATPPNLVKQNADGTYSNIAAGDIPINHRSRVTLISTTQALVERLPKREYSSGNQTITSAGGLTLAHGLGVEPRQVTLWLKCVTGDGGFSVGAKLLTGPGVSDSSADNHGLALYVDSTNINIVFGAATSVFTAINPLSAAGVGLTNSSWKLVVEAN